MDRLLRVFEHGAATLALFAGVAIAVLAVLITIDIVGRDFFGASIQGTDEIGGYVLAFVGSLGMALTLLRRGHPRIELFFRFFPQAMRDGLHALAQLTMAGFALFMAWHAWGELQTTLRFGAITNTPLQTPLWVPQAVWLAGMVFFAVTACLTSVHILTLLVTDRRSIERCYGPYTIEQEVRQYTGAEGDDARD
ncbi:TRAP transporter small permease [uncultured Roseibium sp.]|uniref:TRAP transporter small permease n=1 Tax=uncultured Roseibium sp. TaxID=1936171 RepID=UPI00261B822B|nr:TRAP transporter small permease [uncultured Roseibium sp.]